eukprot:13437394-Ditylum_brightwellii.AAC.1
MTCGFVCFGVGIDSLCGLGGGIGVGDLMGVSLLHTLGDLCCGGVFTLGGGFIISSTGSNVG